VSGPRSIAPVELAELVRPHLAASLLAFDVDGVLSPLVDHADDSKLSPGIPAALSALAAVSTIAIVSGRALESLERLFVFPSNIHVIGSHGLESRGEEAPVLDDDERYRFEQLEIIGSRGVAAAGDGAWLEYKPASVVLHIREADETFARPAIEAVTNLASMIDGATAKAGSDVVELLARSASKGSALLDLAGRLERSPILYLGDDVTDEDAFAVMGPADISVRVGSGDSAAAYRLDGPHEVPAFLRYLISG
jgi:trehalose 6-phosphate phosphatase